MFLNYKMCSNCILNKSFVLILIFVSFVQLKNHNRIGISHNICGKINGHRLYLELGDQGTVVAENLTFQSDFANKNKSEQTHNHKICTLELSTCPSCVIFISFSFLNLSQYYESDQSDLSLTCVHQYVHIFEPPYNNKLGDSFCGTLKSTAVNYTSQTKDVIISLLYNKSYTKAFSLQYMAKRNRRVLKASFEKNNIQNGTLNGVYYYNGVVNSPFFPALYPRDYFVEQLIKCDISTSVKCRIRLIFTDFQLNTMSIMEFYDWNGKRLDVTSGALFRPPIIVSSGPTLLIRFYANGGTGLGYKAYYSYLSENSDDIAIMPSTDCGGYVENLGGGITMMNMVDSGLRAYDCLWIIRPPKNYFLKNYLYLKIVTFEDMVESTDLIVRQGLTSDKPIIEILRYPSSEINERRQIEHIVPITSGFYISLRGIFSQSSRLAIVYSVFSDKVCSSRSDYVCKNHRCIGLQLHCDGFDHCGDNSDEPSTCLTNWELEPIDRRWYSHTPNYYFPNADHYPDLKTATLVFIISSLGLIALISALIILLYRMGSRARQQRELQNQLQTISDLLDGSRHDDISDEPPIYEAPPDYDDVIKVGLDGVLSEKRKKKRISRKNNSTRSKSVPGRRNLYKNTHRKQTQNDVSFIGNNGLQSNRVAVQSTETFASNIFYDTNIQNVPSSSYQNSPPPPYINESSTSNSITLLHGYNEDNIGLPISSSLSSKISTQKIPNQSSMCSGPQKWIVFRGNEPMEVILNYEISNSSVIRRCRSEDDILNSFEIDLDNKIDKKMSSIVPVKNTMSNESKVINSVHESASDSNLSYLSIIKERERLFEKSFKDYKSMKVYFENLFAKSKYPRKQFKYKTSCCTCDGACRCIFEDNQFPFSKQASSEISKFNTETEHTNDTNCKQFGELIQSGKSKDNEEKFSKNKLYLPQFRIWKSTDNNLNNN